MNETLMVKLAESVVESVKAYCDAREVSLLKRIAVLESRELVIGPPGKDAEPIDKEALISEVLSKIVVPVAKDGKDAEPINKDALVSEILAKIVVPADGKDGAKGDRGASINVGEGPPTFGAQSDDSYIDLKTGDVYRWV